MFARIRLLGMHGVHTCGAMIRQSGAVTPQCGAPRTGSCGVTAQAATRAVATFASAHMSAAATTTARVAAATTAAARGDAR
jgi:hypothetical protein